MKKLTPAVGGAGGEAASEGTSRREFLQVGGGAAAGAALMLGTSGAASVAFGKSEAGAAAEPKATVTKPSGSPPRPTAACRDSCTWPRLGSKRASRWTGCWMSPSGKPPRA